MRFFVKSKLICLYVTAGLLTLNASIIYDESVSGDLSNSGLSPTSLTVGVGSNQVFGTTGSVPGAGVDRDYFTISIGAGMDLTAITVLPGTSVGGSLSFFGMEAGNQVTVATNAATAAGLLGWWHYSSADINSDILPNMAIPTNGSSGFSIPLGAGNYSFWIQELSPGPFNYGFDLTISAAKTPEPSTYAGAIGALAFLALMRRRFVR
jgi:hypothetical protein